MSLIITASSSVTSDRGVQRSGQTQVLLATVKRRCVEHENRNWYVTDPVRESVNKTEMKILEVTSLLHVSIHTKDNHISTTTYYIDYWSGSGSLLNTVSYMYVPVGHYSILCLHVRTCGPLLNIVSTCTYLWATTQYCVLHVRTCGPLLNIVSYMYVPVGHYSILCLHVRTCGPLLNIVSTCTYLWATTQYCVLHVRTCV